MDLKDVLDFVEDGLYLLDGQDGLRGGGRGFQGTHGLDGQRQRERAELVKTTQPTRRQTRTDLECVLKGYLNILRRGEKLALYFNSVNVSSSQYRVYCGRV